MIFKWFATQEVDAFAEGISAELVKRFPPKEFESLARKAAARMQKARDAIFKQATQFAQTHTLNLYQKARLANRFKWALREAGYPSEFADELAHELVTLVTTTAAAR